MKTKVEKFGALLEYKSSFATTMIPRLLELIIPENSVNHNGITVIIHFIAGFICIVDSFPQFASFSLRKEVMLNAILHSVRSQLVL